MLLNISTEKEIKVFKKGHNMGIGHHKISIATSIVVLLKFLLYMQWCNMSYVYNWTRHLLCIAGRESLSLLHFIFSEIPLSLMTFLYLLHSRSLKKRNMIYLLMYVSPFSFTTWPTVEVVSEEYFYWPRFSKISNHISVFHCTLFCL